MSYLIQQFRSRDPSSAKGRFYVNEHCMDCDICRELAPEFFARNDALENSYLIRQPVDEEEVRLIQDIAQMCSEQAIRSDGLKFDWEANPPLKRDKPADPKRDIAWE